MFRHARWTLLVLPLFFWPAVSPAWGDKDNKSRQIDRYERLRREWMHFHLGCSVRQGNRFERRQPKPGLCARAGVFELLDEIEASMCRPDEDSPGGRECFLREWQHLESSCHFAYPRGR